MHCWNRRTGGVHPGLQTLLLTAIAALLGSCGPFGGGSGKRLVHTPAAPRAGLPAPPAIPAPPPAGTPPIVDLAVRGPLETPEIDAVLKDAEERFEAAKSFYREGDYVIARRLFDEAITVLLEAPEDALDRHRVREKCREMADAIYRFEAEELDRSDDENGFPSAPLDDLLSVTFPIDPNVELDVLSELKLPVTQLPLEINGEVMRYIRYFTSPRGRKALAEGLKRLGRYRPMIQRILDEEGVPRELIYLALVESGFQPRAVSRKRASGLWQFMRLRGREYGLRRTRYYDDRLDPEKATRAAARHLRDLYERLGDWYLAMAAYNAGPGRIQRGVRRTGYADFWELSRRKVLPRQTRRYVPLILAAIVVASAPEKFGLDGIVADPPLEYNTIEMAANTHLALIADILGKPLEELRALNPAILRDIVPAGYELHVPKGTAGYVLAALNHVPPARRTSWRVHRVSAGETLAEIAELYHTTAEQIAEANGGGALSPKEGDLVLIPVGYGSRADGTHRRSRRGRGSADSARLRRVRPAAGS